MLHPCQQTIHPLLPYNLFTLPLIFNSPLFLPLGYGMMASVRLGTDQDSGRPRGFAHVDFFTPEMAQAALAKLPGVVVGGRELRIDMKKRITERIAGENIPLPPRDWGESSARGMIIIHLLKPHLLSFFSFLSLLPLSPTFSSSYPPPLLPSPHPPLPPSTPSRHVSLVILVSIIPPKDLGQYYRDGEAGATGAPCQRKW